MAERSQNNGFFSGFILGGLVGATLTFLFGTEEGRKIKDQLTKKGKEIIDDLPTIVEDLEKQGEEFAQKTERIKKTLEEKTKELSSQNLVKIESALSHIQEAQERGRRAAAEVRKRFFTRRGKRLG